MGNVKHGTLVARTAALIAGLLMTSASHAEGGTGGGCYNMEIIGVKTKSADLTSTNGHSLFVTIDGRTRINLSEGPFNISDRNGTDGTAAFSLPAPDPTNSGTSSYSVFARLVGKPGTKLDMSTCGIDATGATYCSTNILSLDRIAGTSKFVNATSSLLYIYADLNGDGVMERVPLFDSSLLEYFWQLDTVGRVHAQLRFCPVQTTVPNP